MGMVRDSCFLACQYLRTHRRQSLVLIVVLALIIYMPLSLRLVVGQGSAALLQRAESSPIVLGARGSALELVVDALYFKGSHGAKISMMEVDRVRAMHLGAVIPVYTRFSSHAAPIVGTEVSYMQHRHLQFASGRPFALLGECVVGAALARRLGVQVGDTLVSDPEDSFSVAGSYPLRMRVVGILAPNQSPDDAALFTDIKTTWIMAGLAHGHAKVTEADTLRGTRQQAGNAVVVSESIATFQEITTETIGQFHFHQQRDHLPVSCLLAFPSSDKDNALLQARFIDVSDPMQAVVPEAIIGELLETVMSVEVYIHLGLALLALATLLCLGFIVSLSIQLRRNDIQTLQRMGVARMRIVALIVAELGLVLVLACVLAACCLALTGVFAVDVLQTVLVD